MNLSAGIKKIFAHQRSRAGESGQAVLEYILVLIVTVSILLGILYQFNDAFKNFLDSYFGDYIACLLETGELPSLGGDGPTSDECNARFENYSVASGRSKKDSNGGGSSSGEGGSGGSDASGAGSSGSSGGGSRGGGRRARFSSAGGSPNGEFGSSSSNRPARQRLNTAGTGNPSAEAGESTSDGGFGGIRQRRVIRRRRFRIPETFLSQQARREKKEKTVVSERSKKAKRGISALRQAKFTITPPEDKVVTGNVEIEGLSFGQYLKFMMIAGIIIALFIFLGGQALQIKKSWEKGE